MDKYDPTTCCVHDSLEIQRHKVKKVKGWKIVHANSNQRAWMALLIADIKIDFQSKSYKRKGETLYINKKFNAARKYVMNIYTPNNGPSIYMKENS